MTVQTVETFYAILALVALGVVAISVVLWVAAAASPGARPAFAGWSEPLATNALVLAAIVATLAMLGSLYFSEIAKFEPCRLCWYQRIAMYPLAIVLWMAVVRRDRGINPYVRVLAGIGAVIAAYHVALEWIPALDTGSCGIGPSCGVVWFRTFGFVSLPLLALSAFLLIITLLSLPGRSDRPGSPDPTDPVSEVDA
jgi:disulfide bond formation protein DsbB